MKLFFAFIFFFITYNFAFAESKWLYSSGNYEGHKHSIHKQINEINISNLNMTWKFNSNKISGRNVVQTTPIYVDNKVIIADISGAIYALNPKNGLEIWNVKLNPPAARRGITAISGKNPKIYISTKKYVIELDARNGNILKKFKSGLSLLPPIIDENKLFVATLKNGVKAFDLDNGELLWEFSLKKNNVKPRIWSGFSYDKITKSLFIVTSNPGGLYGGDRLKEDLSISLISINSNSGKKNWHFQHIRHDLWDFDLVGSPMIFSIYENNNSIRVVAALSKTGDVIYLKVKDGSLVFPNGIKKNYPSRSDVSGEQTASFQYTFSKPQPFSGISVDLENDFNHLDKLKHKKLFKIISKGKSGLYTPPSFNYNLILYGLHGGAEWPGGSYIEKDHSIIVPFNKDPWVIRMEYQDYIFLFFKKISKEILKMKLSINKIYDKFFDSSATNLVVNTKKNSEILTPWDKSNPSDSISQALFSLVPYGGGDNFYNMNCKSCHGVGREGYYENEKQGDKYVPSLVGFNLKSNNDKSLLFNLIKKNHNDLDIKFEYDEKYTIEMLENFEKYDNFLNKFNLLKINGFWQALLDENGNPATTPPWGGIAKINLKDGSLRWKIPFGNRLDKNKKIISKGDKSFGGVLTTSSDIFFATGTPDEMARAFSSKDGKLIWERKLPFAGSAPPMTYNYKGCQYVVFTATGGQFVGFKDNGDATVAYKLDDCEN